MSQTVSSIRGLSFVRGTRTLISGQNPTALKAIQSNLSSTFRPRSFSSTTRTLQVFLNASSPQGTSPTYSSSNFSSSSTPPPRDQRTITDTIRVDHRSIHELYERLLSTPEQDHRVRKAIANELVREITLHSEAEEVVVYPVIESRDIAGKGSDVAEHLREEHLEVKKELYELDKMDVNDSRFPGMLTKVMRSFSEHSKEEEARELPAMEQKLSQEELRSMNAQFEKAKMVSPTHPHPMAPQKPPGLKQAVGAATAAMDRAYDATQQFAERRVQ
ncbi:hypothetical protein HK102_013840 [Quaeritorhiza haematococci]|nr:hypothetical protein HK102_013840 [Quaeritorhiza haematococci]